MTTPGAPCWISLFTRNAEEAGRFYSELFDWTVGEASSEFGGYRMFFREDRPVAGLMPNETDMPSLWAVYLATDDVRRTVTEAQAAGAQLVSDAMTVADLGTMAEFVDPTGVLVGAWQADAFAGFADRGVVGAPAWFETLTHDYDRSVTFYRDVFKWDTEVMSDTDDFRYTTLGSGASAEAGIMDARGFLGEDPGRWQFYVQVDDTDATVEKAESLGAALLMPVDDSPYGRLGQLVDPNGVQFAVLGTRSE